jgi:hypothetical protein
MTYREYLYNIGLAASRLMNALRGGDPDEGLSSPIGRSILRGGFFAQLPMPRMLRRHFEKAARWEW